MRSPRTQSRVLALVSSGLRDGRTVAEIRNVMTDEHHGTISGTLSNLHREGRIARLSQKRGRCKIYVMPEYVGGRTTEPQGY